MNTGILATLLAAALFGAGTPLAKLLLGQISPWSLAALLYLGSGLGLWLLRRVRRAPLVKLAAGERRWLAGAVVSGGMIGPVLLMWGLTGLPASSASLLLNAEGVFTTLIAWLVFRENADRRIVLGMVCIVVGSVVLSWPQGEAMAPRWSDLWPALAVLGACLAWAIDNNLTRKVSLADPSWIAMVKGLVAGGTNLLLVLGTSFWDLGAAQPSSATLSTTIPSLPVVLAAALLGFASYGASLSLFVVGLRHLGTARTGAYFSVAPFAGAALAIGLLGEPLGAQCVIAGLLMLLGVALHLTEQHAHAHDHGMLEHSHVHTHGADDAHHDHTHANSDPIGPRHTHWHRHLPLSHSHVHFPDAHHQHSHH